MIPLVVTLVFIGLIVFGLALSLTGKDTRVFYVVVAVTLILLIAGLFGEL